jgi:proline iminopeptidase
LLPTSFVDARGARLAIYEEGDGRDTVILLHGGPGVPDYLADVSAILAGKHRVIRFDQRGTGRSVCSSERYTLQDYVDDLEAIRCACKLERLALFGHSWGGLVAQLYASRYPGRVERLCLANSSIGLGDDWRLMERAVMAHNRRRAGAIGFIFLGLEQLLALLPGFAGDHFARRMMARVWRNYFDPPESAPPPPSDWLAGVHSRPIFATRRATLRAKARDLPSLTTVPVLIILGESDIYGSTTQRLVSRYPSARVVVIPRAGHVPWLQNPVALSDTVVEFFASPMNGRGPG